MGAGLGLDPAAGKAVYLVKLFTKGTNDVASGMGTLGHKSGLVAWSFVTSWDLSVPGSLRATGLEKLSANKALARDPPHL